MIKAVIEIAKVNPVVYFSRVLKLAVYEKGSLWKSIGIPHKKS